MVPTHTYGLIATHIYPGDIWLAVSLIMIPVEFLTGTTIAIGTGIAAGYTGVLALISFGVLTVPDQFMIFSGLMLLVQSGAFLLYKQRTRISKAKANRPLTESDRR